MGSMPSYSFILLCFLSVICDVIQSETVFFTNSQTRLENSYNPDNVGDSIKTYQLEVPGSSPITIIEAEPAKGAIENSRYAKFLRNKFEDNKGFNERRTKDYVVPGSTHENDDIVEFNSNDNCHGDSCNNPVDNKKTVYSPDLLNKFLHEYAERIRNADKKTKEKLQQMEFTTTRDDYVTKGNFEKKKVSETVNIQVQKDGNRRYSSWDEVDTKRHKHPYDDPDGWVALEAVPWSKSKISKWQANTQKINKPGNNYNSFDEDENPDNNYHDRYTTYGKPNTEHPPKLQNTYQYSSKPNTYEYNKPYPESPQFEDDWGNEAPKPSWSKPPKNHPTYSNGYNSEKKPHKPDCNHSNDDEIEEFDGYNRRLSKPYFEKDIIVDDRPNDFPSMDQDYIGHKNFNNRNSEKYYSNDHRKIGHPSTHPSNGDGQWVLLSTTKGYKYPKNHQRSLSLFPEPLVAHRSVRLTVLPAVNGSKENMTLSHGGLLEVEPSFQSVEESKRIYEKIKALNNNSTIKRKPVRAKNGIITTDPTPDASAVVAAVGAGLVPATVAMIMPMVLGRKKRSTQPFFNTLHVQNVTQVPNVFYESTLQKTL